MLQGKFNTIKFDSGMFMMDIRTTLGALILKYADLFVDIFQRNFVKGTSLGPGKPEWRKDLKDLIEVQRFDIANSIIEAEVGFPDNLESEYQGLFVKAMLIMYGSGVNSAFGGTPIYAGPPGRMVWDSDLDGKIPSEQDLHQLPESWNHIGNDARNETMKEMRKFFDDMLNEAYRMINGEFFRKHIRVIPG